MQENLLKKKDNNVKSAEKYVKKYVQDLQNHFGLNDMQIIKILQNSVNFLKKRNKTKKWWQFL